MVSRLILIAIIIFQFSLEVVAQKNVFLDKAYWKNNPTILQIEADIQKGNDPTQLNEHAFDPVVYALLNNVDNKTIKYLLTKEDNDVNKLTHDGRTYVFWAIYKSNLQMMDHLVSQGAKTNVVDNHGYSLLNFAAATGQLNTKLYDFCIAHGADVKKEKNKDGANALLLVAPFLKDDSLINYFTSRGIDLHRTDDKGNGVFNYAAKKGNIEILNLLIKKGVAYKSINKEGGNAFIFASQGTRNSSNTLKTYKYLEMLGIQPNVTTNDGFTPLHALAYKNTDIEIFNYFLEKGLDVNQKDINGNTPLINAAYSNDIISVEFLSKYVKDINTQNKKGISALMRATKSNKSEVVEFLLHKGANVLAIDNQGNSLVYYLLESYEKKSKKEFDKKLQLFHDKKVDFSQLQFNNNNLWHIAVKKNDVALLKKITTFSSLINQKNKEGYTPLHLAAMKAKNTEILKFLLEQGADKTIKTEFDETCLDLARENEMLEKNNSNLNFLQ